MHGVTFGSKHSFNDFGLVLSSKEITLPEPKVETVEVFGRDGSIDVSEGLTDDVKFKNRKLTFTFTVPNGLTYWTSALSNLSNYLHGRKMPIVLDADKTFYYYGRCKIDEFSSNKRLATIVVVCDVDPYKIEVNGAGQPWAWDTFDFVNGIIYNTELTIPAGQTKEINLINRKRKVSPIVTVPAKSNIVFSCNDAMMIVMSNNMPIEPFILQNLTDDTYSAIPDRGIHLALNRLQNAMWNDVEECRYCLKLDARHYYQSIDHEILKAKYRRLFKDDELLSVLDEIIDSIDTADLDDLLRLEAEPEDHKGLPIGNYHSQYGGNFYFSSFDHWIKEEKHIKYYFRYMDDIVIFAKTKEELHALFNEIQDYFKINLKLTIKDNWQIFPTYTRGVDFLGYRVFLGYTLLRKSTCVEMKSKMLHILKKCKAGQMMTYSEWCSINSYEGWLKPCDSYRLHKKYIAPLKPYCDLYYETNIKGKAA